MENEKKFEYPDVVLGRSGRPLLWCGGGALSNTLKFRLVYEAEANGALRLKRPIFVRRCGELACSTQQALVPLCEGDVVIETPYSVPKSLAREIPLQQQGVNVMEIIIIEVDGFKTFARTRPYEKDVFSEVLPDTVWQYHGRNVFSFLEEGEKNR